MGLSHRTSLKRQMGMTLIELLVSIGIFVWLGTMVTVMARNMIETWRQSERRRTAFEAAQIVISRLNEDLAAAYTREPLGIDVVKARMFVDNRGENGSQRLMFVRSIESGPERPVTYFSGAGSSGREFYNSFDDDGDGKIDNNLKALGGLAEVVYFVRGGTLYRGVRSPVGSSFTQIVDSDLCVPVAENVLYFGVSLWTQYTNTWDLSAKPTRKRVPSRGPERMWDSTRGIVRDFLLYRGSYTVTTADDDVFPEKIRVELVLEAGETDRFTTLRENVGDSDGQIPVASVKGFSAALSDGPMMIKIGDEWIEYTQKGRRGFVVAADGRGARGTARASHARGERVRRGRNFSSVFYMPTHKEDWSDDREAARRAGVPYVPR